MGRRSANWIYVASFSVATLIILGVLGIYLYNFSYGFSGERDHWGQFGDYFGGLTNPLLSFAALIIAIKTAMHSNQVLSEQLKMQSSDRFQSEFYVLLKVLDEYAERNIRKDNAVHDLFESYLIARQTSIDLPDDIRVKIAHEFVCSTMKETNYERFFLAVRRVIKHVHKFRELDHDKKSEYIDILIDYLTFEEKVLLMSWAYFEWPKARKWMPYYCFLVGVSEGQFIAPEIYSFFKRRAAM
ncbi:hypothetical protein ACI2KD_07650 [Pseudomonas monteilii]